MATSQHMVHVIDQLLWDFQNNQDLMFFNQKYELILKLIKMSIEKEQQIKSFLHPFTSLKVIQGS